MAEQHEDRDDTPRVDAVIRVASDEVNFWKHLAIRSLVGAFVTVCALAVAGAICLTIVLGRFDKQGDLLRSQADTAATADCNRHIQAELNDVQGITTQAFLSGNIAYFDALQTYRQQVTNVQRNLTIGDACPHLPPRPAPPPTAP